MLLLELTALVLAGPPPPPESSEELNLPPATLYVFFKEEPPTQDPDCVGVLTKETHMGGCKKESEMKLKKPIRFESYCYIFGDVKDESTTLKMLTLAVSQMEGSGLARQYPLEAMF